MTSRGSALLLSCLLLSACGAGASTAPPPAPSPTAQAAAPATPRAALTPEAIQAILGAPDRTDADRKTDLQRHPAELLAFMGVGPGMRVADLGAGGGYTSELLARAVGPSGVVYGQNDPELLKKFMEGSWAARLARPVNHIVVRADRTFDAPLPPEAHDLDVVVDYIFYHDTVWIGVDRAKMNSAVFAALKPAGIYVIVDARAQDGHGVNDAKTLHRIEESVVGAEVKAAGFTLAGKATFLANPADTRDWSSSPRAAGERLGTEDRFVLKFVKPS
jgi:predicted methyltransferase